MTDARVARLPGAFRRIPNFAGASEASEQITGLQVWKDATTIKCNPDSPQRPLRKRALQDGKLIYMAVPRLTSEECFWELDPHRIKAHSLASTIKGAFKLGRLVHPTEMQPIDLIICGSVAVNRNGARLGKGGGYSDLEYALARTLGQVRPETTIVTTVHPLQIIEDPIPMTRHDISVDYIGTMDEVVSCQPAYPRPDGIYWDEVGVKLEEIPILQKLVQPL